MYQNSQGIWYAYISGALIHQFLMDVALAWRYSCQVVPNLVLTPNHNTRQPVGVLAVVAKSLPLQAFS